MTGPSIRPPWGRLLVGVLLSGVVPVLVYGVVRAAGGGDVVALAVAGAVPAVRTVVGLVRRGRPDPLAVLGVIGFGVALVIAVLGGGPLALELHEPVVTGAVGAVFLGAAALRVPAHLVVARWFGRAEPGPARRSSLVYTALIGSTLLVHALALVVLALSMAPAAYVAESRLVGLPILLAGAAVLVVYRNRQHA